jgi:hypothetical protein
MELLMAAILILRKGSDRHCEHNAKRCPEAIVPALALAYGVCESKP